MNKKILFITAGVIITVGGLIGGGLYFFGSNSWKEQPQTVILPTSPPQEKEETAQWIDQSEFRFDYPKSLSLNPHPEDKVNYAYVELTSSVHPGNLIVWTKDTSADTIDVWAKNEKIQGAIDSTLDGYPAIKVLRTGEADTILTSTIRNGYLYQIETRLVDKDYWSKIYDGVISSFAFISSAQDTDKTSATDTSTSSEYTEDYVDEEVIE